MFNFQNMSLKEEYILFSSFLLAGISCWLRCNVEKLSSHAYTMNWTIVVLWSLNHVQLFAIPWTAAHQASLPFTTCQSLFKLMSIDSVVPSNHPILCRPLLLLPSIPPCIIVFSNESALCIKWPKYWSFSFSPSNEYSRLISLGLSGLILLLSRGLSKVFSSITIWKHQFFSAQPSLWSNSHICAWFLKKP